MIPNLTMIVAAYAIVLLLEMANRPLLGPASRRWIQVVIKIFAGFAIVLIGLCTLDTLGTGLSLGTSIEEQREHNRQDFSRRTQ